MKQCPRCGAYLNDNIMVCPRCHTPQNFYNGSCRPPVYDKSKVLTGIFAIVFGGLGLQYFYLGKVTAGILTILISLVTCGGAEILWLIQGIFMLTLSDADFQRKYVDNPTTFPLF